MKTLLRNGHLSVAALLSRPRAVRAAVAVAAIPTAYTGASGIFVIAAGAVIYAELRAAGARRQLALAATAMSGSLGVVLRPCLLVVIIAYLNREVTTDMLFGWGLWVFLLTVAIFLLVSMTVNCQGRLQLAPVREALPASLAALKPLLPYAIVVIGVILFYEHFLEVAMDEFSAPRLLSVMLLGMLAYESGIDPVHFWMVTLVAFELGYLSPPVALNHLLARQVVGEAEVQAANLTEGSFYQRHEHVVMPLIVMGISLVIAAFGPLLVYL